MSGVEILGMASHVRDHWISRAGYGVKGDLCPFLQSSVYLSPTHILHTMLMMEHGLMNEMLIQYVTLYLAFEWIKVLICPSSLAVHGWCFHTECESLLIVAEGIES